MLLPTEEEGVLEASTEAAADEGDFLISLCDLRADVCPSFVDDRILALVRGSVDWMLAFPWPNVINCSANVELATTSEES